MPKFEYETFLATPSFVFGVSVTLSINLCCLVVSSQFSVFSWGRVAAIRHQFTFSTACSQF